jgi:predicted phage tail protein
MLSFPLGSDGEDFHIVPVIAGAGGRKGVGKAIIGAVLMIVAVVGAAYSGGGSLAGSGSLAGGMSSYAVGTASSLISVTWGGIFRFGAILALSGISQMMQPSVKQSGYNLSEDSDQRASFFLGGQVNQSSQGIPVVIGYGRCCIGSATISAGLSTERV